MNAHNIEPEVLEEALKRYLERDASESNSESAVSHAVEEALKGGVERVLADLMSRAPQMLAERRAGRIGFQARLYARWMKAFDLYETICVCAEELGGQFNAQYRPEAASHNDLVFDVLVRLHARACHVAEEVYSLLRSGQATGAMARWRTLHEVAVVSYLICQKGRALAQRYLDHEVIEAIKASNDYQRFYERLGAEPGDPEHLRSLLARRQKLCRKYGSEFQNDYGWAAADVGKSAPTIRDLEAVVSLDHLRPYYRLASHGIHANPKGITFELEKPLPEATLIVEASNAGLADPGQSALISLGQVTINLLTSREKQDIGRVVSCAVLQRMIDEACQAFITAHTQLVAEERQHRDEQGAGTKPAS